jgi:hypothetical protein
LNVILNGFRPWGYYLTNVLLHAVVSALVYLLLRCLLGGAPGPEFSRKSEWLPFGLALIFAWHPIHVETVSFVAGRFDLLCALFYLLALLLGLASLRPFDQAQGRPFDQAQGRPGSAQAREIKGPGWRIALATGAGLSFLLALTAKEMAVTLPLALIACYAYHASHFTAWARFPGIHRAHHTSHVSRLTVHATRLWPM